MTPRTGRPLSRRLALPAATTSAALLLFGAGATACQRPPDATDHGARPPTNHDTGLQPTDSFGYLPQHETTVPTAGIGPAGPDAFGDDPFDNPGPPLPGGPGLPARADAPPMHSSPAG